MYKKNKNTNNVSLNTLKPYSGLFSLIKIDQQSICLKGTSLK